MVHLLYPQHKSIVDYNKENMVFNMKDVIMSHNKIQSFCFYVVFTFDIFGHMSVSSMDWIDNILRLKCHVNAVILVKKMFLKIGLIQIFKLRL